MKSMKRKLSVILKVLPVILTAGLLSSCSRWVNMLDELLDDVVSVVTVQDETVRTEPGQDEAACITEAQTENTEKSENSSAADTVRQTAAQTEIPETTAAETVTVKTVDKQGSYTSPEDVAEYIHTFGTLPSNFITKKEAQALGWDNKAGNLWEVAEGMSIGGDYFGNYEGLLPDAEGRKYTECDVNYDGGYRGAERIIFSNDGLIYYTGDHYKSFTLMYGNE